MVGRFYNDFMSADTVHSVKQPLTFPVKIALFDNKIGRIAESSSEGNMQMEIEAMGQTIEMKTTQTTTLRLKGAAKTKEKSKESPPPQ